MAKILIVDDHAFFRRGLEAALTNRGFEIAGSVGSGDDALAAMANQDIDVILLDLKMRDMDGVTVLQTMRARQDNRPVIVLTAELSDVALVALMRASVNGIVFKHCSEARLFEAIEAVLKGMRFVDGGLVDKAFSLSENSSQTQAVLNSRELQVAELVSTGLRNREIAARLGTSEAMVKLYLHKAYQKLGVSNRTELALKMNGQVR